MRAAIPGAVILRPSMVFGPEDHFFNKIAQMAVLAPVMPVLGAETRVQPVLVADVARAAGLVDGEKVEIETQDGDILVRRRAAHAQARLDAEAAAEEIIVESRAHSLGNISLRELLDDGRRG